MFITPNKVVSLEADDRYILEAVIRLPEYYSSKYGQLAVDPSDRDNIVFNVRKGGEAAFLEESLVNRRGSEQFSLENKPQGRSVLASQVLEKNETGPRQQQLTPKKSDVLERGELVHKPKLGKDSNSSLARAMEIFQNESGVQGSKSNTPKTNQSRNFLQGTDQPTKHPARELIETSKDLKTTTHPDANPYQDIFPTDNSLNQRMRKSEISTSKQPIALDQDEDIYSQVAARKSISKQSNPKIPTPKRQILVSKDEDIYDQVAEHRRASKLSNSDKDVQRSKTPSIAGTPNRNRRDSENQSKPILAELPPFLQEQPHEKSDEQRLAEILNRIGQKGNVTTQNNQPDTSISDVKESKQVSRRASQELSQILKSKQQQSSCKQSQKEEGDEIEDTQKISRSETKPQENDPLKLKNRGQKPKDELSNVYIGDEEEGSKEPREQPDLRAPRNSKDNLHSDFVKELLGDAQLLVSQKKEDDQPIKLPMPIAFVSSAKSPLKKSGPVDSAAQSEDKRVSSINELDLKQEMAERAEKERVELQNQTSQNNQPRKLPLKERKRNISEEIIFDEEESPQKEENLQKFENSDTNKSQPAQIDRGFLHPHRRVKEHPIEELMLKHTPYNTYIAESINNSIVTLRKDATSALNVSVKKKSLRKVPTNAMNDTAGRQKKPELPPEDTTPTFISEALQTEKISIQKPIVEQTKQITPPRKQTLPSDTIEFNLEKQKPVEVLHFDPVQFMKTTSEKSLDKPSPKEPVPVLISRKNKIEEPSPDRPEPVSAVDNKKQTVTNPPAKGNAKTEFFVKATPSEKSLFEELISQVNERKATPERFIQRETEEEILSQKESSDLQSKDQKRIYHSRGSSKNEEGLSRKRASSFNINQLPDQISQIQLTDQALDDEIPAKQPVPGEVQLTYPLEHIPINKYHKPYNYREYTMRGYLDHLLEKTPENQSTPSIEDFTLLSKREHVKRELDPLYERASIERRGSVPIPVERLSTHERPSEFYRPSKDELGVRPVLDTQYIKGDFLKHEIESGKKHVKFQDVITDKWNEKLAGVKDQFKLIESNNSDTVLGNDPNKSSPERPRSSLRLTQSSPLKGTDSQHALQKVLNERIYTTWSEIQMALAGQEPTTARQGSQTTFVSKGVSEGSSETAYNPALGTQKPRDRSLSNTSQSSIPVFVADGEGWDRTKPFSAAATPSNQDRRTGGSITKPMIYIQEDPLQEEENDIPFKKDYDTKVMDQFKGSRRGSQQKAADSDKIADGMDSFMKFNQKGSGINENSTNRILEKNTQSASTKPETNQSSTKGNLNPRPESSKAYDPQYTFSNEKVPEKSGAQKPTADASRRRNVPEETAAFLESGNEFYPGRETFGKAPIESNKATQRSLGSAKKPGEDPKISPQTRGESRAISPGPGRELYGNVRRDSRVPNASENKPLSPMQDNVTSKKIEVGVMRGSKRPFEHQSGGMSLTPDKQQGRNRFVSDDSMDFLNYEQLTPIQKKFKDATLPEKLKLPLSRKLSQAERVQENSIQNQPKASELIDPFETGIPKARKSIFDDIPKRTSVLTDGALINRIIIDPTSVKLSPQKNRQNIAGRENRNNTSPNLSPFSHQKGPSKQTITQESHLRSQKYPPQNAQGKLLEVRYKMSEKAENALLSDAALASMYINTTNPNFFDEERLTKLPKPVNFARAMVHPGVHHARSSSDIGVVSKPKQGGTIDLHKI